MHGVMGTHAREIAFGIMRVAIATGVTQQVFARSPEVDMQQIALAGAEMKSRVAKYCLARSAAENSISAIIEQLRTARSKELIRGRDHQPFEMIFPGSDTGVGC